MTVLSPLESFGDASNFFLKKTLGIEISKIQQTRLCARYLQHANFSSLSSRDGTRA
jgi:hypothetical protein